MPRKRSKKKSQNFNQYLPLLLIGALVIAFVFLGADPTGKFGATGKIQQYTGDECGYPNSLLLSEGSEPPINCCYNQMGDELWCVGDEIPQDESPPPIPGQECTPTGDCDEDGYTILDGDCVDIDPLVNPADNDGDGYSTCDNDCNDNDASLSPADNDGDGWSTCDGDYDDDNALCTDYELSLDNDGDGYNICDRDCDDNNANVFQNLMGYEDKDGDGHGWGVMTYTTGGGSRPLPEIVCSGEELQEGFVPYTGAVTDWQDCDDNDASVYPGNTDPDFFVDNSYPDYNCNNVVDLPLGTIFVRASGSSVKDLSGLTAIDAACNQAATSENLAGNWAALMSSYTCESNSGSSLNDCDVIERNAAHFIMMELAGTTTWGLDDSNNFNFYNVQGELIADRFVGSDEGSLFSWGTTATNEYSLYNAPKYQEDGSSNCNPVWTGSSDQGLIIVSYTGLGENVESFSCDQWTASSSNYPSYDALGSTGYSCDTDKDWNNQDYNADCGNSYTNYCIRTS